MLTEQYSRIHALDCSLFKDWNDSADQYAILTIDLDCDNHKKFWTTPPKRLVSAITRSREGMPTNEHAIQDVHRVAYEYALVIMKNKGVITPILGNRKGYCFVVNDKKA